MRSTFLFGFYAGDVRTGVSSRTKIPYKTRLREISWLKEATCEKSAMFIVVKKIMQWRQDEGDQFEYVY